MSGSGGNNEMDGLVRELLCLRLAMRAGWLEALEADGQQSQRKWCTCLWLGHRQNYKLKGDVYTAMMMVIKSSKLIDSQQ